VDENEPGPPMQRLILMRHAKTEPWVEGIDDFARQLTETGHRDARHMAEAVVARGWLPNRILMSTARRTRETAVHVAAVVDGERVRPMEELYLCGVQQLADVVAANQMVSTLMIIGHNPGVHDFAMLLARTGAARDDHAQRRLMEKFPTSCTALFDVEDETTFRLVDILRAADFRAEETGAG
jgi:phosphohistidine phosphatase